MLSGDDPPALLRAVANCRTALGLTSRAFAGLRTHRSEDADLRTKVLDSLRPIIPSVFRTFMGSHHEPTLHIIGFITVTSRASRSYGQDRRMKGVG